MSRDAARPVSFDDALKKIRAFRHRFRLREEKVALVRALGRVTAGKILARMPIPPFDNSAMDGFAARSRDLRCVPSELSAIETIPAGRLPAKKISAGECARIMTGSPMPLGADAVVMKEDTRIETAGRVTILVSPRRGENVRYAGEDVKRGDSLVEAGSALTGARLGLLAAQGFSDVKVVARPRVGFLTTGDEIVDQGRRLKPGQIYNANKFTIAAAILSAGCEAVYLGHFSDDEKATAAAIFKNIRKLDALVTCGGVSMGDYDVVKKSIRRLGAKFIFEKIKMKPGRPSGFATLFKKPVFTLPGNVVSALMAFELLARPLLQPDYPGMKCILARAGFSFAKRDDRRHFLRIRLRGPETNPTAILAGAQGSGILSSMVAGEAFAVVPEGAVGIRRGAKIKVAAPPPAAFIPAR